MITYRGHIVYVVTVDYPTNGVETSVSRDIVRAAQRADLATEKLGVISDGRVLPLSSYEHREVRSAQAFEVLRDAEAL